jgi:hypothetical protein
MSQLELIFKTQTKWNALIVPLVLMNVMTIMESVIPKGLIRYASEDEIEKKAPFKFITARMKVHCYFSYFGRNLIGLLFLRTDVEATTRLFYQQRDNTVIFYL